MHRRIIAAVGAGDGVDELGAMFLGEQLRGTTLAGGALILVGVALAAQST